MQVKKNNNAFDINKIIDEEFEKNYIYNNNNNNNNNNLKKQFTQNNNNINQNNQNNFNGQINGGGAIGFRNPGIRVVPTNVNNTYNDPSLPSINNITNVKKTFEINYNNNNNINPINNGNFAQSMKVKSNPTFVKLKTNVDRADNEVFSPIKNELGYGNSSVNIKLQGGNNMRKEARGIGQDVFNEITGGPPESYSQSPLVKKDSRRGINSDLFNEINSNSGVEQIKVQSSPSIINNSRRGAPLGQGQIQGVETNNSNINSNNTNFSSPSGKIVLGNRREHNQNNNFSSSLNNEPMFKVENTPIVRRESNKINPVVTKNVYSRKDIQNIVANVNNNNIGNNIGGGLSVNNHQNQSYPKINFSNTVEHRKSNLLDEMISGNTSNTRERGVLNPNYQGPVINNNYNKIQINNVNNIINNIINTPDTNDYVKKSISVDTSKLRPIKLAPSQVKPIESKFVDYENKNDNTGNEFVSRRHTNIKIKDQNEGSNDSINNIPVKENMFNLNSLSLNKNSPQKAVVEEKGIDTLKVMKIENSRRRTKIALE